MRASPSNGGVPRPESDNIGADQDQKSGAIEGVTEDEAKKALLSHVGPDLKTGFLGMLRPYGGLQEERFHEVMAALAALGPSLGSGSTVAGK